MPSRFRLGRVDVDLDRRTLHGPDGVAGLTPLEAGLLRYLAGAAPDVATREELLEHNSVRWQDGDFSWDRLSGSAAVDVPNSGEVLMDVHVELVSAEASGLWLGVGTSSGVDPLWCNDDVVAASDYTFSQLAAIPYTCTMPYSPDNGIAEDAWPVTASGEVTSVELYSLMSDANGADDAKLYRYSIWVR